MGDFLIGLSIPIGILILLVLLRITLIKLFKKKSTPNIQQKGSSTQSESASGATPPPADHANAISSAKPKTNSFSKIFWTIITVVLIVAALVFIVWAFTFVRNEVKSFPEPSHKTETVKTPDVITETYPLNKDSKKIRVYTHDGYTYERYSGGWKYYCTHQNGVKTLRGDGNSKEDGTVKYFDLEFYEVECIITVIFTKDK